MSAVESDLPPFTQIPHWLIGIDRDQNLTGPAASNTALRLYMVLGVFENRNNHTAYPRRQVLANLMGVSTKTVDRAIDELEALGALVVNHRFTESGDLTSNEYKMIHMSPGSDTDDATSGHGRRHGRDTGDATGRDTSVATRTRRSMNQKKKELEKTLAPVAQEIEVCVQPKTGAAEPVDEWEMSAQAITRAVWDRSDGRPDISFIAAKQIVKSKLKSGYDEQVVFRAAMNCDVFTKNGLGVAIDRQRDNHKMSSMEKNMQDPLNQEALLRILQREGMA